MHKRLAYNYNQFCKKIEEKHGKLGLGDKLIVKMTLKEAIKEFVPDFKEDEMICISNFIVDYHSELLKPYGLDYLDESLYLKFLDG